MDYQALGFWFVVLQTVLVLGGGWFVRSIKLSILAEFERQSRDLEDKLQRDSQAADAHINAELKAHGEQIATLQASQITHEDLGRIYRRMEPIQTEVSETKGMVSAIGTQLGIVTQHLISKGSES